MGLGFVLGPNLDTFLTLARPGRHVPSNPRRIATRCMTFFDSEADRTAPGASPGRLTWVCSWCAVP